MLNIEKKDNKMIRYENLLIKFLTEPNSLSQRNINKLTHWCLHNFYNITNCEEIIDKLYQKNPNRWALSAALKSGNEAMVIKFWDNLKNYAYDELVECISYSGNTNLYKLDYDHIEKSSFFNCNLEKFCMDGIIGAIQTNVVESEAFMKNRYPQINIHNHLLYGEWIREYLAALILNSADTKNEEKYYDHAVHMIKFLIKKQNQESIEHKISQKVFIHILENIFFRFNKIYRYNAKKTEQYFF